MLGYCAYTAAIGAFSFWAPEFLIYRFPKQLDVQSANFWFGLITVVSGVLGTILGGQWADRRQRGIVVPADAPHDHRENRRGINELLRVCAIGMIFATPLTAVVFFMPTPAGFFAVAFLAEIGLFLDHAPGPAGRDVLDPYYGHGDHFEDVLDLLEDGVDGLMADLRRRLASRDT